MIEKLRQLPAWQITLGAIGVLLVFVVGGYFVVTALTNTPPPTEAKSTIPADLGSKANADIVKKLEAFEPPEDLPILTEPLSTPDPNVPSTVNPFSR